MTHPEQQARFDRLVKDLQAAEVLEADVPPHHPLGITHPLDPTGPHENPARPHDTRVRRPLWSVRWDPAPGEGKPPLVPMWRKDVAADDPARKTYQDLAGGFLADILA